MVIFIGVDDKNSPEISADAHHHKMFDGRDSRNQPKFPSPRKNREFHSYQNACMPQIYWLTQWEMSASWGAGLRRAVCSVVSPRELPRKSFMKIVRAWPIFETAEMRKLFPALRIEVCGIREICASFQFHPKFLAIGDLPRSLQYSIKFACSVKGNHQVYPSQYQGI